MDSDLAEIWNKLSLTEEEEIGIKVAPQEFYKLQAWIPNCLVGKLLTKKPFNRLALKNTMERAWKEMGLAKIEELGDNLFLFQFRQSVDREVAIRCGPWNFDNKLILLKHLQMNEAPSEMEFKNVPIWIQIHDLPIHAMTQEMGKLIGSKIGEVIEVKADLDGIGIGNYLKVRVNLQIEKPLLRRIKLDVGEQESRWVYLKYERLPGFCSVCGRIGHHEMECHIANQQRRDKGKVDIQYGGWLKAEPKTRTFQSSAAPPIIPQTYHLNPKPKYQSQFKTPKTASYRKIELRRPERKMEFPTATGAVL